MIIFLVILQSFTSCSKLEWRSTVGYLDWTQGEILVAVPDLEDSCLNTTARATGQRSPLRWLQGFTKTLDIAHCAAKASPNLVETLIDPLLVSTWMATLCPHSGLLRQTGENAQRVKIICRKRMLQWTISTPRCCRCRLCLSCKKSMPLQHDLGRLSCRRGLSLEGQVQQHHSNHVIQARPARCQLVPSTT